MPSSWDPQFFSPSSWFTPTEHTDPTAFSETNKGDSTAPGNIAYQGIGGTQDSATQFFRSLTNAQALHGSQDNAVGHTDVGSAKTNLQKVVDYYGGLVSGNRDEILSSIGPEADHITTQFDNIRKMLGQSGARGGGTASTLATLPQQQTGLISGLINDSRRKAVGGLQSAAGQQAGIGFNEQQLGQAQTDRALQAELAKMGINLSERGQNIGLASTAISALL